MRKTIVLPCNEHEYDAPTHSPSSGDVSRREEVRRKEDARKTQFFLIATSWLPTAPRDEPSRSFIDHTTYTDMCRDTYRGIVYTYRAPMFITTDVLRLLSGSSIKSTKREASKGHFFRKTLSRSEIINFHRYPSDMCFWILFAAFYHKYILLTLSRIWLKFTITRSFFCIELQLSKKKKKNKKKRTCTY